LTLRVPAAKLEEILSALEPLGQVEGKNISGQDVTEEYYDTTARKANLEKQEQRLLELYNKAGTVKDILEIENELTRVRGEIESLQARLNVLDNLISLATITVELRAPGGISTGSTLKEPLGTRLKAAWQMGVNGLVNFSEGLLLLGAVLLPYTPFAAAAYLLFYYIVRKRRLKSKDSPTDRGTVSPLTANLLIFTLDYRQRQQPCHRTGHTDVGEGVHHLVDILVGARRFVQKVFVVPAVVNNQPKAILLWRPLPPCRPRTHR
jgi:hypothetical protein